MVFLEVLTHILSHLPPTAMTATALVSRRFHTLVTTPHAWRVAFSRYFPGPYGDNYEHAQGHSDRLISEKRAFSRLTALASWRSEYILRTRLLSSLSRGRPAQVASPRKHGSSRSSGVQPSSAVTTYPSQLYFPVSHIDGSFHVRPGTTPLFIHGAVEQGVVSVSDPGSSKTGSWGLPDQRIFQHFADLFQGEAEYGLGVGNLVGLPNSMDVSQGYGMVYGEGCPQGRTFFISSAEQRGRFLGTPEAYSEPANGIPFVNMITNAVSCVWIAKSPRVLQMTNGLIGILTGSSAGILTAYSLGPSPCYERRFDRGQITAKWVISPGVPIIGVAVDENFSAQRYACRRIWAVVLNALGEVFYLTEIPTPPEMPRKASPEQMDRVAWKTGRSVRWELIELTRRTACPDPYNAELVDGSYTPRSSSDAIGLDECQLAAETKEIENFLAFKPKHFRKVCVGWDMRRVLQVDFAGNDQHSAGESVIVLSRGLGESETALVRRYSRQTITPSQFTQDIPRPALSPKPINSLFGGSISSHSPNVTTLSNLASSRASSHQREPIFTVNTEWRVSDFTFDQSTSIQITTSALDNSTYAYLAASEDPLLGMTGASQASSPMSSPMAHMTPPSSTSEIPGQRARYLAVGTSLGKVYVWDVRAQTSSTVDIINSIPPLRVIRTDSPQVSSVALTSLYLVHGGSDGLVQAWDPLASSAGPIRTLNSRFSPRAQRHALARGIGNNYFAAGALCLDPDPTTLRGIVSLGPHLRYWSYSSSTADEYKGNRRRLRRSHRGSNGSSEGQRFSNSGRGALRDFIADEHHEMQRQKSADQKKRERLRSRFGTDLLGPGATEEEMVAYAQMLSEEIYKSESSVAASSASSDTIAVGDSSFAPRSLSSSSSPTLQTVEEEIAPDIAEAIRLSLLDDQASSESYEPLPSHSIPIRYAKGARRRSSARSSASGSVLTVAEDSSRQEQDDLEFALQLSLAEEQTRAVAAASGYEEFPALGSDVSSQRHSPQGKGKGRAEW